MLNGSRTDSRQARRAVSQDRRRSGGAGDLLVDRFIERLGKPLSRIGLYIDPTDI